MASSSESKGKKWYEAAQTDLEFVQALREAFHAKKLPQERQDELIAWALSCTDDAGLILRQEVIDRLSEAEHDESLPLMVAGAEERLEGVHPGTVGNYLSLLEDDEEVIERVEKQDVVNQMDPPAALAAQGLARITRRKQEEEVVRAAEEQMTWPDRL